ncbi:MAG: serine/threonine-protein kinase, partial [Planctomycetota bacterium]
MSAAADESELVAALVRTFPSLAGLEPAESWRRVEGLGVFAAQLWSAGHAMLVQHGLPIPVETFEALAPDAGRVAQARRNGVAFLVRLRAGLRDQRFAPFVATVAQHYSRTHQVQPLGAQTVSSMDVGTLAQTEREKEQQPSRTSGRIRYEIAGFEIVQSLGEGAMGKVFKARQKSLDRFVALKVLAPHLSKDEDFVRRFEREGKIAAKIEHPNVVRVIEQGHDQLTGYRYIAFEFIDGQTLQDALKNREKFPEREVLAIGKAVAEALAAAEKAGVVHRDVKPANIIIARDGVPKLVDLGLSKKLDDKGITASLNYIMGTPAFISPEAASGHEVDHRSDLYSFGLTLFRLLTGRLAHEASTPGQLFVKHTTEDCPDPRAVEPTITDGASKVVLKLSARRPEDRYQSASDAARDLDLVLQGKPPLLGVAVSFSAPRAGSPGGGMIPDDPPWTTELLPASVPDAALAPPAPADPAEAMLKALERSGDPEQLAQAIERFQAAIDDYRSDVLASAKDEAALARAYLLRGDRSNADQRVTAALEKDQRCRPAVEVLWRGARGDADRSRLELGLAQVRNAVAHGKLDIARKLSERLRE